MPAEIIGACFCGAIRYCAEAVFVAGYCHCTVPQLHRWWSGRMPWYPDAPALPVFEPGTIGHPAARGNAARERAQPPATG